MFTYLIVIVGCILLFGFSIFDRLRAIRRTQAQHSQWLQELLLMSGNPAMLRRSFQAGGHPPAQLNPLMLSPYVAVMTESQNHRYRQWLLAESHEPFTIDEVRELEKSLAANESR